MSFLVAIFATNTNIVLVTGGAGFIGHHLVKRLSAMDCKITGEMPSYSAWHLDLYTVSQRGHIVTNNHVVGNAKIVVGRLVDGNTYTSILQYMQYWNPPQSLFVMELSATLWPAI
jgi:nucleoside-diphosphate-sugar epimerase